MPQSNSPILIQYYKTKYAEFILGAYEGELCMLDYRYRKSRDAVDARLQRLLKVRKARLRCQFLSKLRLSLMSTF